MKSRIDYKYIIAIVAIFFISVTAISLLLEDDSYDEIANISNIKEPTKIDTKELARDYDKPKDTIFKTDIENKIKISKKIKEKNSTKIKIEKKRFEIAKGKSDDLLFDISILSDEMFETITNKNISGVLNLDNKHSKFILPLNRLPKDRSKTIVEIKYKNRIFRGEVDGIFNNQYDNYSLEIDLIDDFANIYLVEQSNNKLTPLSDEQLEMIKEKIDKEHREINEEFLNSKMFTKIVDKP